jgi:hypothetical protein
VIFALFCLFLVAPCNAGTIFVDVDAHGANNGTSWADAYNYLQDALHDAKTAVKPIEIRIAQGTYTPDSCSAVPGGTGNRATTFRLINGVAIKGGYAGFGQPDPNARNIDLYKTILSGDLTGNDWPNFTNNNENSYHVVMGNGTNDTALLDGFTITAGNADEGIYGGGMLTVTGSPTLSNCTFIGNRSTNYGGGMYNQNSNPAISQCTFIGNSTTNAQSSGGGIHNHTNSSPSIDHCTFNDNLANIGGGISNYDNSNPNITNCTIINNKAVRIGANLGLGSGIYNKNNSNPIIDNCFISNNSSEIGGGIYNHQSSPVISNCTITYNSADFPGGAGGGIVNYENCNPVISNCIISNNITLDGGGGGIYSYDSDSNIINCIISDNNTATNGGAILNAESYPIIRNCIINNNNAAVRGGGFYNNNSDNKNMIITNCIICNNTSSEGASAIDCSYSDSGLKIINCTISNNSGGYKVIGCSGYGDPCLINCIVWDNQPSSMTIRSARYCDIEGGHSGVGNINIDPCFADPCNDDYHLKSEAGRWDPYRQTWVKDPNTSLCIDAGDPNSDWTAELWPHGKRINMGACGGTKQASMSLSAIGNIADLNNDDTVDYIDLRLFTEKWLNQQFLLPEDLNRNVSVDFCDFAIFANNWPWL